MDGAGIQMPASVLAWGRRRSLARPDSSSSIASGSQGASDTQEQAEELADRAAHLFRESGQLLAAGDRNGVSRMVEELRNLCPNDRGLARLAEMTNLVFGTDGLDAAHHRLGLPLDTRTLRTLRESLASLRVGSRIPLRDVNEKRLAHPALAHFVANAADATGAFVEALVDFASGILRPVVLAADMFLEPRLLLVRVRAAKRGFSILADTHQLLEKPFNRLCAEAELLEALLTAEFKMSVVKGLDAAVELVRAREAMVQFLDTKRSIGFDGRCCPGDPFQDTTMLTTSSAGQSTSATSNLDRGRVGSTSRGSCASACESSTADVSWASLRRPLSTSLPGGSGDRNFTRLEKWFIRFHEHCVSKHAFLFAGGFAAASLFGPRQVMEPHVGAGSFIGASVSSDKSAEERLGSQSSSDAETGSKSKTYLQDLHGIAAFPGVSFVGVFINSQQLPHLRATKRSMGLEHNAPAALIAALPFLDSAWLLPIAAAEDGTTPDGNSGSNDFEWWSLACVSTDKNQIESGMGTRLREGTEAIDAWRHDSRFRLLRTALGVACRERHAKQMPWSPQPASPLLSPSSPRLVVESTDAAMPALSLGQSPASDFRRQKHMASQGGASLAASISRSSEPASPPSPFLLPPSGWSGEGDYLLAGAVKTPETPIALSSSCPAEPGSDTPYQCLVMPLDLGWFPSPMYLGLVFDDQIRASTPLLSSNQSFNSQNLTGQHDACNQPRASNCRLWKRIQHWISGRVRRDAASPDQGDATMALKQMLLEMAHQISGSTLRSMPTERRRSPVGSG